MKFEGQVPHFCLKEILSTLDLGELADFAAWKKKKRRDFLQVSYFVMWGQRPRGREPASSRPQRESIAEKENCVHLGLTAYQAYDVCMSSIPGTNLTEQQ